MPLANYFGWENGVAPELNEKNFGYLKKIREHYRVSWEHLFEGHDSTLNLTKAAFFLFEHLKKQSVQEEKQGCSGL